MKMSIQLPDYHAKLSGITVSNSGGNGTFFYPIIIMVVLLFLIVPRAMAIEIPVQWSDTVGASDTSTVCTTTTYSKTYPVYDDPFDQFLYLYPTFDIRGVPSIQATRNCSIKVEIQYSMNDSLWKWFDSLSVDIGTTDSLIYRSKRIKLDSVSGDSILPRANYLRAKVTKWVHYTAADTSIVGNIYTFKTYLWLTERY